MVKDTEKAREDRVRGRLRLQGHVLHKDRARNRSVDRQGGYMIVEASRNVIIAGERFDLTLDDVEAWAAAE